MSPGRLTATDSAGGGVILLHERCFAFQKSLQFISIKTCQVEVESLVCQSLEFLMQQFVIPAGIESQPIVGQDVSPLLRIREMAQYNDRDLL